MAKRKSSHRFQISPAHLNIILLAILLTLFGIYRTYVLENEPNSGREVREMGQLPSEIKKELQVASPSATFRVPVLLYHYVEYVQDKKDTTRQSLNINPYIFETQVKTLKDAGFTFMTASDIADVLDGKKALPQKPVALTFDDGYRDLYTDVLPILKKYGAHATAFIVPGFIDGPNSMYAWQLKDVAGSGLVEIGAHTMHHSYLKGMALSRVQFEVDQSKEALQKELGIPVSSFAYPYGAFDKQTEDVVKNAGFRIAISTVPGVEVNQADRFFVYRIRPGARTGEELIKFLEQKTFHPY